LGVAAYISACITITMGLTYYNADVSWFDHDPSCLASLRFMGLLVSYEPIYTCLGIGPLQ
jgi:hypothetical protein